MSAQNANEPTEAGPPAPESTTESGGSSAILTKRCKACGQEKPLEDFYPAPRYKLGRCPRCIPCDREYQRKLRAAAPERYREYSRASRKRLPPVERTEADRERDRERYRREAERLKAQRLAYKHENPEKRRAHRKLLRAVNAKQIERPDSCGRCGRECKPQGHHADYSQPLVVEWLCASCHRREHSE